MAKKDINREQNLKMAPVWLSINGFSKTFHRILGKTLLIQDHISFNIKLYRNMFRYLLFHKIFNFKSLIM